MQRIIAREGGTFLLEPWDWWYYAGKVKQERFALDEEMLRPYFELANVRKGAFDVATKLYGITFVPRTDIPVYHKDVEVFEVREGPQEADGHTWWYLVAPYDESRAGWAAAEFLGAIPSP